MLKDLLGIEEGMIFSTCNRTEVYYVAEEDRSGTIIDFLCREKGIQVPEAYYPYFWVLDDEAEAVRYLFEVSMGLKSSVLGDLQIPNQVKKAYVMANELNMAGAFLHRLMHTIFHTNKRVHQETPYRDGAASVSYAAAELATELSAPMTAPRVLVIGLGEMGTDVALNLDPGRFGEIHLCNRTPEKAHQLAARTGASVLPFELLYDQLHRYDVVISSVSAPEPILSAAHYEAYPLDTRFIIDLSLPRSAADDLHDLPQVIVYHIDDIRTRTEQVMESRKAAIPQVQAIIEEESNGFLEWRKQLIISPAIHQIKSALERIRQEELNRYRKDRSPEEMQLVETVTQSMLQKILRLPVLQLKKACKRDDQENLVDIIIDLFDLEASRRKQR